MGWKIWQQNEKNVLSCSLLMRYLFQVLTTTLLSLLLPLSFLLLARLTAVRYIRDLSSNDPTAQSLSLIFSLFLYTNPTFLHVLVSIVCASCLVHGLKKGPDGPLNGPPKAFVRTRLYAAWVFLCTLQVLVGLGIEGSIGSDTESLDFGYEKSLLVQVIFFLGLHETMLHWSRKVVKPVVDDTVFGHTREEMWVEKLVMAAGFSTLWWWRLKDEVDALVVVPEVKKEMLAGVGVADFVGWWLYYVTVTIGMVRVFKGGLWFGMLLSFKKVENNGGDSCGNDEKV